MTPANVSAEDYVFGPASEIWQVNRYATGLLFGPAAVLLQVAHPRVAQGVAEHSDFRGDALGRLKRTLTTVNSIAFGTREDAEYMRKRMTAVHQRVQGDTAEGVSGKPRYSAFEPDLLMWVLATLFDASFKGYEFAWGPLSLERREHFYRDFRKFGTYFGLGEGEGPQNHGEFVDYFDSILASDLLGSHPLCAEVAAAVVRPPAPLHNRLLGMLVDFLPIETISFTLRKRLLLRSTYSTRGRMAMLRALAPHAFHILPKRLTYYPEAYRAEHALRR